MAPMSRRHAIRLGATSAAAATTTYDELVAA